VSFGPSGKYDPASEYFLYECDEYDRNFLHFSPLLSLLTSVDYDHPDTYPTEALYTEAFHQFIRQSAHTILWQEDAQYLQFSNPNAWILEQTLPVALAGAHNRRNATLVAKGMEYLGIGKQEVILAALSDFPGTDRRFERIDTLLYSDYGHHPKEIAATLQLAREVSERIVLVYQPHQNRRQHRVKDIYKDQFTAAEKIYWLPTYLSREDPTEQILTPEELTAGLVNRQDVVFSQLDNALWQAIQAAREDGALVLCMGAGTIDGWLRRHSAL
jgi:UDP-N-acetylmuramate--alanine ligase